MTRAEFTANHNASFANLKPFDDASFVESAVASMLITLSTAKTIFRSSHPLPPPPLFFPPQATVHCRHAKKSSARDFEPNHATVNRNCHLLSVCHLHTMDMRLRSGDQLFDPGNSIHVKCNILVLYWCVCALEARLVVMEIPILLSCSAQMRAEEARLRRRPFHYINVMHLIVRTIYTK